MNKIEKTFRDKRNERILSLRNFIPSMQLNYLAILRMLAEKEQMPKKTLLQLARRIKPLVRPDKDSLLKYRLYWIKPYPLKSSFYSNFKDSDIVKNADGKILPVKGLKRICEFTCYHQYGGYYGFLRPSMDEVIQQFPAYLLADPKAEYAVEVVFPSDFFSNVYDAVLDRHVSTVIVYRMTHGFPKEIRKQKVCYL